MALKEDTALVRGAFFDRARAQAAFDALTAEGSRSAADLSVVFYGSQGVYVLFAEAKSPEAADWAAGLLSENGASVQEQRSVAWLASTRHNPAVSQLGRHASHESEMLAQWLAAARLLLEQGLLDPDDLFALAIADVDRSENLSADERRRRKQESDEELREVSERLEAGLRERYPELFDRKGRLRRSQLARRVTERTGGKHVLSGTELSALEEESDVAAGRSMRAP
jgi:hypothetical protein